MTDISLKLAITANALFSSITGLVAVLMAGRLSQVLGPPSCSLRVLGGGLLVFAALVAKEARAPRPAGTRQIIVADAGWVLGATAIVAWRPGWLTAVGQTVLIGVTMVVAGVAVAQWRGLRSAV